MKETSAVYECIRSTLGKNSVFSVSHLCEISGVSRSGYYAWLKTEPARKQTSATFRWPARQVLPANTKTAGLSGVRRTMLQQCGLGLIHRQESMFPATRLQGCGSLL